MDVISNDIPKPALLSVDDAKNLGAQKVIELFSDHLSPASYISLEAVRDSTKSSSTAPRACTTSSAADGQDPRLLRRLRLAGSATTSAHSSSSQGVPRREAA
jgi:hypothetical protein